MMKIFCKMSLLIKGDTTWVYGYSTKSNQQSSHWKSPALPCPKKAWQTCSCVKQCCLFSLSSRHYALWINFWKSINILSDDFGMFMGHSMKKITWNVNSGKLALPSW
jgi:hypothetical protein